MLQYINVWVDPCTGNPHWNPLETTTNREKQLPHSPPEALLGLGRCRMTRPARRATSQLPCQYRSKLDIPRKCIVFWCSIKNGKLYTFHPQNPFFFPSLWRPKLSKLEHLPCEVVVPSGDSDGSDGTQAAPQWSCLNSKTSKMWHQDQSLGGFFMILTINGCI